MSKLINGELLDEKVKQKIFAKLHKGKIDKVNAIVVHQTGGATAEHTFNSYGTSPNGAHFLIDKDGTIYQTALTTKITHHVGKLKSRCLQTGACTPAETSAANAVYLQKGISYSVKVQNLHKLETSKNYPDRYPSNNDSIGIEIAGQFLTKTQSYEPVNAKQNASLKWLVAELSNHLSLQAGDIYRHPDISYKQATEASSATW
ncbi:MAG: peptidoglycan recognition family protein [Pseudomonadota bacterium]